jgi:hypothetical protein
MLGRRGRLNQMARWPSPEYHISVVFAAPLSFVYSWCTHYTPEDPELGGEHYERRILSRSSSRVVFENLYKVEKGWGWERHVVTLMPPNRWHSEGTGNYSDSTLDYTLSQLSAGKTKLDMRWRSRPTHLSRERSSRAVVERFVTRLWRRRARALEREYRSTLGAKKSSARRT